MPYFVLNSKKMSRLFGSLLLLLLLTTSLQAQKQTIRVGSKAFAENEILGHMILITLQEAGFSVEDHMALGNTGTLRDALENNLIDVYPEYTGTAYANFNSEAQASLNLDATVSSYQTYVNVSTLDVVLNDLVWLQPTPASNSYALTITREFSEETGITNMSEFASYVNDGGIVKLATNDDFAQYSDGLPLFEAAYNFDLTGAQMLVVIGAPSEQTQNALASGINNINVAMAYSTDGIISALDLVVIVDDQNRMLTYQPAPVFRGEVLRANPEIVSLINPLFAGLSEGILRELNAKVQVDGDTPANVARTYLSEISSVSAPDNDDDDDDEQE